MLWYCLCIYCPCIQLYHVSLRLASVYCRESVMSPCYSWNNYILWSLFLNLSFLRLEWARRSCGIQLKNFATLSWTPAKTLSIKSDLFLSTTSHNYDISYLCLNTLNKNILWLRFLWIAWMACEKGKPRGMNVNGKGRVSKEGARNRKPLRGWVRLGLHLLWNSFKGDVFIQIMI